MTFSKSQRLLLASAAAFGIPTVVACWRMLSSEPQPASGGNDRPEENAVSTAFPAPAENPHQTADAHIKAEGKTDADHFQQYVETLRAQGVSENTVRELTVSRITAAFQARRTAIHGKARLGHANDSDIQAQLDALGSEQASLITRLVGAEDASGKSPAAAGSAADAAPPVISNPFLSPAVLASEMPATVKTEEQAAEREKLRNDFVQAIGGENQDPASPDYRKRWVQAQSEADQRYRLLFGDNAFVQHQMKAQQEVVRKEQELAK